MAPDRAQLAQRPRGHRAVRIAVVCPYDLSAPGGVQDQVIGLVERLGGAGHEAWAVAPGDGGPDGTRHIGRTIRIPANRSTAPVSLSPRTPARVRAAVEGADVVHIHEPLMPMASLALLRSGTPPSVGTFHADPGALVRGLYRGAAPILRRLVGRLDVVTAVSETARSAIARFTDARIVPNAVDVAGFRDAVGDRDAQRVVFIGRDEPRKGLDVLLSAWPEVRVTHPTAALRVVGTMRDEGPDGVTFLGRVSEADKRSELASAGVRGRWWSPATPVRWLRRSCHSSAISRRCRLRRMPDGPWSSSTTGPGSRRPTWPPTVTPSRRPTRYPRRRTIGGHIKERNCG